MKKSKTFYACKCEAHELTRKVIPETQNKDHEDHTAERQFNSMSLESLVHKPIPVLQAMNIPDARTAADKEWDKLKNIPASQESKVARKQEVIDEAQKEGETVHCATVMDLCH